MAVCGCEGRREEKGAKRKRHRQVGGDEEEGSVKMKRSSAQRGDQARGKLWRGIITPLLHFNAFKELNAFKDKKSLGSSDGIPPAPHDFSQIEVKFDTDANGILSVTAVDKGTGKKQDIIITGASTLPSDEVRWWKEDKEKRDAIDTKR
ncbi:stromal 70 kDa heat shock-related protein, chloroplastic-like [Zingiber officinale]|uniref:stromal 70 kDa heat shock-related protein, chloroplastic-like n=1 Tax=Zingiber officinale TaxID=94328 RepID=UPI001C4B954B|nr:stromal 70 kDa heat shock-related protein, chloroplastic-like [Zingiber officinale]